MMSFFSLLFLFPPTFMNFTPPTPTHPYETTTFQHPPTSIKMLLVFTHSPKLILLQHTFSQPFTHPLSLNTHFLNLPTHPFFPNTHPQPPFLPTISSPTHLISGVPGVPQGISKDLSGTCLWVHTLQLDRWLCYRPVARMVFHKISAINCYESLLYCIIEVICDVVYWFSH